jgi:hypothetical protein
MLSLLLITAMAIQTPPAPKPTQDTTAQRRPTTSTRAAAPRDTNRAASVSRMVFHDRMRELWSDHITYTRQFIVSAAAGQPDTAVVLERLLRNQDEIGEAVKPYYGDTASSKLTSLLRSHIQLAGKAFVAAKGTNVSMAMQDTTFSANRMNVNRTDTTKIRSTDTTQIKTNPQYPTTARTDTTRAARQPQPANPQDTTNKARIPGDTSRAKAQGQLPTARTDSAAMQPNAYAQAPTGQAQVGDTAAAFVALRANGDSIATLLAGANPRNFSRETLRTGFQMHINLLLQEVAAHLKKDWSGSIAAFDESHRQAMQMADMLSEGIMKQFPSRFNNRPTNVSSLQ